MAVPVQLNRPLTLIDQQPQGTASLESGTAHAVGYRAAKCWLRAPLGLFRQLCIAP